MRVKQVVILRVSNGYVLTVKGPHYWRPYTIKEVFTELDKASERVKEVFSLDDIYQIQKEE